MLLVAQRVAVGKVWRSIRLGGRFSSDMAGLANARRCVVRSLREWAGIGTLKRRGAFVANVVTSLA